MNLKMNDSSQDLHHFLFSDYEYEQDLSFRYIDAPFLKRGNKNQRFTRIEKFALQLFTEIMPKNLIECVKPKIDPILFNQATSRFSRDIYGQLRLDARLQGIEKKQKDEIKKYMDYGFKVNSSNPYIHRKFAVFFYWFSVLKPFSLEVLKFPKEQDRKASVFCTCYNEFMTYYLLKCVGRSMNLELELDTKSWEYFEDFLTDLHFRNLSRSSLEFFLASYQVHVEAGGSRQ